MTISKALKKLYTAMCGGETNKNTAGDLIEAIADDYAGGGGGGDTYETVAIIAVETEQSGQIPEGWKQYSATMEYDEANYLVDNLQKSFFLGETKIPIVINLGIDAFCANAEIIDNVPHILATPAYVFFLEIHGQQAGASVTLYSTETIADNTNIRIFEKTSGGSITVDDALSDTSENPVQNKVITAALAAATPLIVHGTWATGEGGNPNTVAITTPLADIYAAAQAGRAVFLEYTKDGENTRMGLVTYKNDNGAYALAFSICTIMSDKPAVATVEFDNSIVGEFAFAVGQ